jgi:hypothetical protein
MAAGLAHIRSTSTGEAMFDHNPNGAGNTTIELDAPDAGTRNFFFNVVRAMPDLTRGLGHKD